MGLIVFDKGIIDTVDTDLKCPICTASFDASNKMDKAKNPYFRTKCPECKAGIGILIPLFGGGTKVYELAGSESLPSEMTETEFTVRGL